MDLNDPIWKEALWCAKQCKCSPIKAYKDLLELERRRALYGRKEESNNSRHIK